MKRGFSLFDKDPFDTIFAKLIYCSNAVCLCDCYLTFARTF